MAYSSTKILKAAWTESPDGKKTHLRYNPRNSRIWAGRELAKLVRLAFNTPGSVPRARLLAALEAFEKLDRRASA